MFLLSPDRFPSELLSRVTHRDLREGEILYHRGDPAIAVFAVEKGRLQLRSYSREGKPVTIYVARAGECVSEAALFASVYCSDVMAETASRVAVFPREPLLQCLRKQPELSEEFMAMLARRFNAVRIRLELRNMQSAHERVLQYLAIITPPGEHTLVLDRPLKYIAEDLGLSPETFYRTLAQLAKEGLITRRKRSISTNFPARERSGALRFDSAPAQPF
jgi:CRP/FNR family transcriptional regulator, dissimilatory nitrate respiration regulator